MITTIVGGRNFGCRPFWTEIESQLEVTRITDVGSK